MPVIDAVASDYQGRVTILAVAGRSTPEASAARVGEWFSPDRLMWGYSDEMFGLFGVPGQPVSVLVTSDGFEVLTRLPGDETYFHAASYDQMLRHIASLPANVVNGYSSGKPGQKERAAGLKPRGP